jgi:hypothetical protein
MGDHDQLIWHSHVDDAHRSIHDDGRTLPPIRKGEYFHQYDDYANEIPDSEYLPPYARPAFLFRDKVLIPDTAYVHGDSFTPTEWEAQFSNLTGSGDEQSFTPVINDNYRVVGHLGWIGGNYICVPRNTISEYSPNAAVIQKARLAKAHRRLVWSHNHSRPRMPGLGQPFHLRHGLCQGGTATRFYRQTTSAKTMFARNVATGNNLSSGP